jgi:type II secretory pathway pseudopilin PulG
MKGHTKKGFTVLELVVVIAFTALVFALFFMQKANVDAMDRDEQRKTAINAMYYALEEGFYKENEYYPEVVNEDNLKVIDPALFTDPRGINLGQEGSSYRYEPVNCEEGKCQSYTLRGILEKEDEFIKQSRH